jgi:hypothetical protein
MRLGSSLVLVKHAAKEVASAYPGSSSLPDQGPTGGRAGPFQPKHSVWTLLVEVLDLDPEDLLQVPAAENQQPVKALGANAPQPPFRVGVGVGRRHRCDSTSAPSARTCRRTRGGTSRHDRV